jgi:hypothetical protein
LSCYDTASGFRPRTPPAPSDFSKVDIGRKCDIRKLYSDLASSIPKKSDYETNDYYFKRSLGEIPTHLWKDIFCEIAYPPEYNAEKKSFLVFLYAPSETKVSTVGSFKAQNSFGATLSVEQRREEKWEIEFADFPRLSYPPSFGSVDVPFEPRAAELVGRRLRSGVIGDAVPPFTRTGEKMDGATTTKPVETTTALRTIYVRPRRFVLYNNDTGEVLWSAPVESCASGYGGVPPSLELAPCPIRGNMRAR